jgi:hypothetical protein
MPNCYAPTVTAISDRHYEDKDRERVAIRLRFVGEGSRGGVEHTSVPYRCGRSSRDRCRRRCVLFSSGCPLGGITRGRARVGMPTGLFLTHGGGDLKG